MTDLTELMREIREKINGQLQESAQTARQQALVDVSGLLVWLHLEPAPPIEDLRKWVLSEFSRASDGLDPSSVIRKKIDFYRSLNP